MGFAVSLGVDEALFVRVAAPCCQNFICQLHQPGIIGAGEADAAHGPVDDARFHILKAGEDPGFLDGGFGHGEFIMAALEMVVAQDAATHNGQVGVAAHEIVGEEGHKVQQLAERGPLDLHGGVVVVEDDAVLIVIDIRAVLQIPRTVVDGQRDDAVILAGGVVHPARVALVLHAELALGVGALGGQLGCCNGLGVFFGLGEINGDIQIAVGGLGHPLEVPLDAVAADVVRILAELVEPVGGGLRALIFVPLLKVGADDAGPGGEHTHEFGVKQVAGRGVVRADTAGDGVVQQCFQDGFQVGVAHFALRRGEAVQLHGHEQLVADVNFIVRQNKAGVQAVVDELLDGSRDIAHRTAPPSGRMERTWQRPSPKMASMLALNPARSSTGTKACTVPAKPPPWTRTAPLPPRKCLAAAMVTATSWCSL